MLPYDEDGYGSAADVDQSGSVNVRVIGERGHAADARADDRIGRAATFLRDAMYCRSPGYLVTPHALAAYAFYYSRAWRATQLAAASAFMLLPWFASPEPYRRAPAGSLNRAAAMIEAACLAIFVADLALIIRFRGLRRERPRAGSAAAAAAAAAYAPLKLRRSVSSGDRDAPLEEAAARYEQVGGLEGGICLFAVAVALCVADAATRPWLTRRAWSGWLAPAALFHFSAAARNAAASLRAAMPAVLRVIALELFVVLGYACFAFALFGDSHGGGGGATTASDFGTLARSFVALFAVRGLGEGPVYVYDPSCARARRSATNERAAV